MIPNYFGVLGLPTHFDVDAALLEQQYFALQRNTHPDKHTQKNVAERAHALRQSMLANEAYETLKSPLKRARYLLALHGIALEGKDAPAPPSSLLMEVMELREALQSASNKKEVEALLQQNEAHIKRIINALSDAFAKTALPLATTLTLDLSYRIKFADELRIKQKLLP